VSSIHTPEHIVYVFARSLFSVLIAIASFYMSAVSHDTTFIVCGFATLALNWVACHLHNQGL
jgi:hypothetical protein